MGDVLLVAAVVFAVFMAVLLVAGVVGLRKLRRRNAVGRRSASKRRSGPAAPLPWLVAPTVCARLHRRLRTAIVAVRSVLPAPTRRRPTPPELSSLAQAADELEGHALALDRELLLAARLRGPAAFDLRRHLARQVREVERLAARLAAAASAATSVRPGVAPSQEALAELGRQLDALDAAREEVARLEAKVGLLNPS